MSIPTVLDSIAAPMRGDENYSTIENSASRAALLIKLAAKLKMHASRCTLVLLLLPRSYAQSACMLYMRFVQGLQIPLQATNGAAP